MRPIEVAALLARRRWRWAGGVAVQPPLYSIVIKLLAPQESGESLSLHISLIVAQVEVLDSRIELVCFLYPLLKNAVEIREWRRVLVVREAYIHAISCPWLNQYAEMSSR